MMGLYIHIPFCISKCKYCDFASYSGCLHLAEQYVDALCREMDSYHGYLFDSVYFGGGTPTLLNISQFYKIFEKMHSVFTIATDSEITLEANPATLDFDKACELKKLGFNRVSLGAQSFVDSELATLGRVHSSGDTVATYNSVRAAGFDNISLDLMYALPGQTMTTLGKSIDGVLNLAPEHISCYGLTIEENTQFGYMAKQGIIEYPDDDVSADMYAVITQRLEDAGYSKYEISNFAKQGYHSRHNCKYWNCVDYVGIGLGASGCVNGVRYSNCQDFDSYFNGFGRSEEIALTIDDKISEFVILGLRLIKQGVNKQAFKDKFNMDIYIKFGDVINRHISNGLLRDNGSNIALTEDGCYVSNYVMSDFII